MKPYPQEMGRDFDTEFELWSQSVQAQQRELDFSPELQDFFENSIRAFLSDGDTENRLVSPLNIYLSLSLLSEVTEGDSRQEIMSALNCPDMDTLRKRASDLWNSHYRRDGATSLLLANSLWLRDDTEYNADTLNTLASEYYTASFAGQMGSEEYHKLLSNWLSQQTDGLLDAAAGAEGFDAETLMALASSVCYRAKWSSEFQPGLTLPAFFYAPGGEKEIDFMHRSYTGHYYWGEGFGAIKLPLANGGGSMSLILPDKDVICHELISQDEVMDFIFSGSQWDRNKYLTIKLSMPKFDVESAFELKSGLNRLGIEAVFSEKADFSPLCDAEGLYLSQANHAVRLAVDEEGVSAAAYTLMAAAGAGMPPEEEIDFTLNRPFIFVISSDFGQPLIAGLVNNP